MLIIGFNFAIFLLMLIYSFYIIFYKATIVDMRINFSFTSPIFAIGAAWKSDILALRIIVSFSAELHPYINKLMARIV